MARLISDQLIRRSPGPPRRGSPGGVAGRGHGPARRNPRLHPAARASPRQCALVPRVTAGQGHFLLEGFAAGGWGSNPRPADHEPAVRSVATVLRTCANTSPIGTPTIKLPTLPPTPA